MKPLIFVCLLLFAFIYYAAGIWINPFAIWNATPLAVTLFLFRLGQRDANRAVCWGAIGFLLISMSLSVYGHLAWMFDWDGTRTGSSTSALLFVVLPIFASGFGFLGFAVAWWVARTGGQGPGR